MINNISHPWTEEQLRNIIQQMKAASHNFYMLATGVSPQNHAFIEFTGLMNEYIAICTQTLESGGNFACTNTHGSGQLIVYEHNMRYIEEKLNCIYDNVFDIKLTMKNEVNNT